jgi:hypothetical protein
VIRRVSTGLRHVGRQLNLGARMRQFSSASQQHEGLRTRLTDPVMIATAAELLRQAGYTELAIWRHFLDAFTVDLDALSLIMRELFRPRAADPKPDPGAVSEAPSRHKAGRHLRAA